MLKVKSKFLFLTIFSLFVLGACSSVPREERGVASEKKAKKSYEQKKNTQDDSWQYYSGQYR